jgi:HAD superfamily hydrolase (TIGR01484 family)
VPLELPKTIRAVFTDLDGTLTDGGIVQPSTIEALGKLRARGFWVVLVTGRPAGWADCLMRLWPLDAAIFENGAGYYCRRQDQIELVALAGRENASEQRTQLRNAFEQAKGRVPKTRLATDQPFRLFDFAIDHSEQQPHLTASEVEIILQVLRAQPGVVATPSSTHINYLFGNHTKRTGAEAILTTEGASRGIGKSEVVFIGDSLNDEPCFEFFEHCVGVANISSCWHQLSYRPKQITKSHGGKGFEELAYCLLTP